MLAYKSNLRIISNNKNNNSRHVDLEVRWCHLAIFLNWTPIYDWNPIDVWFGEDSIIIIKEVLVFSYIDVRSLLAT